MPNRLARRIAILVAATGLIAATFMFGYSLGRGPDSTDPSFAVLREVQRDIEDSAIRDPQRHLLVQEAIRGMLRALDDTYAAYFDAAAYRAFLNDTENGQYSGVGLWLKQDEQQVKVVSVLPDTPAARAGIRSGDIIERISGRSVARLSLDEVVQKIQGRLGTAVTVAIRTPEGLKEFGLVREQIELPVVRSKLLPDRIGSIQLLTFNGRSAEGVRKSVKDLTERGARGFILDLRGNPGGPVREAVGVASVFLDEGIVVSYKERNRRAVVYRTAGKLETKASLVVLVDEGSASSSEIVAGAIQDRGRGIVLGTTTYGKGSVQSVFPLSDGSAVKLTIASYHTPSGRSIGGKGIVPDVEVFGADEQMAKARQVLRDMLAGAPRGTD